jgi:biopolymer transport protein ExbB/TolQ
LIPILVVGFFGLLVCLERTIALYWLMPMHNADAFFRKLREMVRKEETEEAIETCQRFRNKPVGFIALQALLRANQPSQVIEHGIGVAVSQMASAVQKRTAFLSTVANVATLLGLFGTILGLIRSFEAIGNASAQQRSALLTEGISTAMNSTLVGLGVAIPCLIVYSLLASRTNRHLAEIEEAAMRSMEIIEEHYYSRDDRTTPTNTKAA